MATNKQRIAAALAEVRSDVRPPPEPPWLTIARREIGVHETLGAHSTDRIDQYLRSVLRDGHPAVTDETPWCSAFVNWCMQQAKLTGTNRLAARSWLKWGVPISTPRVGCIVVLWRDSVASPRGHVGMFLDDDSGRGVTLLGGNQHNSVSTRAYPAGRVLGYRWLVP